MAKTALNRKPVTHIVLPGYEMARAVPRSRETVTAFLRRTGWAARDPKYGWGFRNGLPTVLLVNGCYILRKEWSRLRISKEDFVVFVSQPMGGQRGGSGKQVIGLVALVAVAAFATAITGGLAAGAFGTGSLFAGGSLGAGLLAGAVGITGDIEINALKRKI